MPEHPINIPFRSPSLDFLTPLSCYNNSIISRKDVLICCLLNRLSHMVKQELKETFVPQPVSIIIGTAITTFGLYNVHQQADITEGGILRLILLLNFWHVCLLSAIPGT